MAAYGAVCSGMTMSAVPTVMTVAGWRGTAVLGVCAVLVAALPLVADAYTMQLASTALVAAAFALSLQLLVGGGGMVSLGHAAFFGIGAYAVRLVPPVLGSSSIFVTLPAAGVLAGLAALGVGALSMRTRGFFFLMTTLAFGQMLFFLFHDTPLGGGADGVFVERPTLSAFGLEYVVARRSRAAVMLWLNLGVLVGMYAGLAWLLRTMFGRALLGIRANEHRMASLGFDTVLLKLAAFVGAGALAGVAGCMKAMTEAFVSPELLGWQRSAEGLLAIVLGGMGALHGPVLGAFAFVGLGEVSHLLTERVHLVEGAVILLVVLFLPRGLAGVRGVRA